MRCLFFITIYVASTSVLRSSSCSSKSFSELPRYTDHNPRGWYSILEPVTHNCGLKYKDINVSSTLVSLSSNGCNELLRGVEMFHKGISYMSSNMNPQDFIIPVNCKGIQVQINGEIFKTSDITSVQLVDEIEFEVVNHDKATISHQWINAVGNEIDENLRKRLNKYSEMLRRKKIDSFQGIQLKYIKYMAEVGKFEPSRALLFRYRSLPGNLYDNITLYIDFLGRYGNFFRTKSILGGFLEFIPKTYIHADSTLENVNYFFDNQLGESELILQQGGVFKNNISLWKQSLTQNSVLLNSEIIPIQDLLSTNSHSKKKKSMQLMEKYITSTEKQKNVLKSLEILNVNLILADFIIQQIKADLQYVCGSEVLDYIVQNWIVKTDNLKMERYTVMCQHDRWYNSVDGEEQVITRIWKLLPGVCFTNQVPFSTCVNAHFILPVGIKCINFFTGEGCTGKIYAKLYSVTNLADALIHSKSFAYC